MDFRFCPLCAEPLETLKDGNDAGRPACPTGHFVHYINPALTTYAFIENDAGQWLALRRAHAPCAGEWDMPGGFVEAGELPDDSLRREIVEETGLEVGELTIVGIWGGRYGGPNGKHTVDIAYRCKVTGGEWNLSDEKSEHAWVALADFPEPAFTAEQIGLKVLREHLGS